MPRRTRQQVAGQTGLALPRILPVGGWDLNQELARGILGLIRAIRDSGKASRRALGGGIFRVGLEFSNKTFEMHPWVSWSACTCGADSFEETRPHHPPCSYALPNFRCGGIVITWTEEIGKRMTIEPSPMPRDGLRAVFIRCVESLH